MDRANPLMGILSEIKRDGIETAEDGSLLFNKRKILAVETQRKIYLFDEQLGEIAAGASSKERLIVTKPEIHLFEGSLHLKADRTDGPFTSSPITRFFLDVGPVSADEVKKVMVEKLSTISKVEAPVSEPERSPIKSFFGRVTKPFTRAER